MLCCAVQLAWSARTGAHPRAATPLQARPAGWPPRCLSRLTDMGLRQTYGQQASPCWSWCMATRRSASCHLSRSYCSPCRCAFECVSTLCTTSLAVLRTFHHWAFGTGVLACLVDSQTTVVEHAEHECVLCCALQGPPPQLEAECGGRHFSRGMREVVASCLNKDPAKRPTAKQLLSKG